MKGLQLRKLTLSAILTAFTVVVLYIGSVVEVMDLSLAAMAALVVVFSVMEMGGRFPLFLYLASTLLSLLLLPNKLPAILYALMMGVYPLFKFRLERFSVPLCWTLKLLFFNASMTVIIYLTEFVLGLPDTGFSYSWVVYLLGNVTYLLFDLAVSRLIIAYQVKWRKRFRVDRFFGV